EPSRPSFVPVRWIVWRMGYLDFMCVNGLGFSLKPVCLQPFFGDAFCGSQRPLPPPYDSNHIAFFERCTVQGLPKYFAVLPDPVPQWSEAVVRRQQTQKILLSFRRFATF